MSARSQAPTVSQLAEFSIYYEYLGIGCAKLYSVVMKVLGCIAPRAHPISLTMNGSPSEKKIENFNV